MEFLVFALAALVLWLVLGLRRRIAGLEAEVARLRAAMDGVTPPAGSAAPEGAATPEVPGQPRADLSEPTEQDGVDRPGGPVWGRRPRAVTPASAAMARDGWARGGQGAGLPGRLGEWLRDHWIYPAAGAALVLSGIFLVQYAVETGLLTPEARVLLALVLALLLVVAGEWLRRMPAAGTILPATLAGSGIAIAMAAVLAALHLYAMIAPATALAALALLAFGAIALGWMHGPLLAALGLLAGTAAPFLLGGGGPPPPAIFGYFALLSLAGLGIDAARRWGWVSWLALAGPMPAMVLWRLAGADATAYALAVVAVAAAAMTLPFGRIVPVADGPRALGRAAPRAGVRASFLASTVAALGVALLVPGLAGPLALTALAFLIALWCRRAPALGDQMVLPLIGFPLWIVWQGLTYGPVLSAFTLPRLPESPMPLQLGIVLVLALLSGLAMIGRGETVPPGRHAPWTLAALILPGGAVAALETTWNPAPALGPYVWALHAMALAALATLLALRYAARDGGRGPRLGASAAVAFALVALGLMLMLGQAALTIALAILMVAASAMDRRFDIPALGAFLVLSVMALLWRLVLDPGLAWHLNRGDIVEAMAAVLATLAGPLAALWLTRSLQDDPIRRICRMIVQSVLTAVTVIGAGIAIHRLLGDQVGMHAQLGLQATVLIALAWLQLRLTALGTATRLRRVLAWSLGILAGLTLALALGPVSPVFGGWLFADRVTGWPLVNDLLAAYLLPGLVLSLLARRHWLRFAGWALIAAWAAHAIRHLWQGDYMQIGRGIAQGELYAYTFALLLTGAVIFGRAVVSGRGDLRKLGLAVVALAAAKAFLVDAAELDGLLRVGAFLALGLSLAGLAWLNGWALLREGRARPVSDTG